MKTGTNFSIQIMTRSSKETEKAGWALARLLQGGEVILLRGNLGAGKTTFVKGLAEGLGVRANITSPTFVLMKVYETKKGAVRQFVHVDCYRIPGTELTQIGLGDYFNQPDTVTAIEWSERMRQKPKDALTVTLEHGKKTLERRITVSGPKKATLRD